MQQRQKIFIGSIAAGDKGADGGAALHHGQPLLPGKAEKLTHIVAGIQRRHTAVPDFKRRQAVGKPEHQLLHILLQRGILAAQGFRLLGYRPAAEPAHCVLHFQEDSLVGLRFCGIRGCPVTHPQGLGVVVFPAVSINLLEQGVHLLPVLFPDIAPDPLLHRLPHVHGDVLHPAEHGIFLPIQTFGGVGGKVQFKNQVIYFSQGFQITLNLGGTLLLVPVRHVHAHALKFLLPLGIDTLGHPAEQVGLGPVAAQHGNLPGDGGPPPVYPIQVALHPLPLVHGNHQVYTLLVQLYIFTLAAAAFRQAQNTAHPIIDIGNPRCGFTGVFHKAAGDGVVQVLQVPVFLLQGGNIRQNGVRLHLAVLPLPGSQGVADIADASVPSHQPILNGTAVRATAQTVQDGGIGIPVPGIDPLPVPVFLIRYQVLRRAAQHPAQIGSGIPDDRPGSQAVAMIARNTLAENFPGLAGQCVHAFSSLRILLGTI